MEVTATITKIIGATSFTKRDGTTSNKYEFVAKVEKGEFYDLLKFDVFGDEKWNAMNLYADGKFQLNFDIKSKEYNGRWYTNLTCWSATNVSAQAPQQAAPAAPQNAYSAPPANEDVPF